MVGQGIVFNGVSGSWLITSYTSPTQVVVSGTVGAGGGGGGRAFSVGYHTGTPFFQLVTGSSAYYLDIEGITFNGTANGRTATYCLDLATANGDVTVTNCRATASTNSGIRVLARRCHLSGTVVYAAGSHGFELTSTALNDLRMVGCEAYSNANDGFNISGSSEGTALIECIAHNNTRHGFQFAGSNRSTLVVRCVAAANAQHGFDMSSGVDLHVIGCVSANNGTTSSHRQFSFGTTTNGTRALVLLGNAAFAAGSTVATDATDASSGQLASLSASPLRSTAVGTFDGRLANSFRRSLSTYVPGLAGLGVSQTSPPGLSQVDPPGAGGGSRVLSRP
jgi:parallel beta-helix repeat protein